MAYTPTAATITSPQLLGNLFGRINTHLKTQLLWLDRAYGKAERLTAIQDGAQIVYPGVYANTTSGIEYTNLLPDGHIGEYSFWVVEDGWNLDEWNQISKNKYNITASLIFWYNLKNVYPLTWKANDNQNVIREVFTALASMGEQWIRINPVRIWEETPNIYRGFTHQEILNQFRMRPYGGFRIEMSIQYIEPC